MVNANIFAKIVLDAFLDNSSDLELQKLRDRIDMELIGREGYRNGRSAATWIDGDPKNLQRILKGIEDGDPEVLDSLPSPDFSGEWADSPTWTDVWSSALGIDAEWAMHMHDTDELEDEYREKYAEGVNDEIIKTAQGYGVR